MTHRQLIFLELPQGIVVTGMDQNGNGNGQDMVTVLQQQFVQMPRSEAFRLGYIHPQLMMPSIGGVSGGIMAATPTVFAVQPQTSQLMTIGTNQIANQTQVVVQQRNCYLNRYIGISFFRQYESYIMIHNF